MPNLITLKSDEDIERIALISRAIQNTQPLKITYTSTSSGEGSREIVPVAFADNLLRWHLRAYDRRRRKFTDFVVARIRKVAQIKRGEVGHEEHPGNDTQWHTFVELKIRTHPHNATEASLLDSGSELRKVKLRSAMAGYFLQVWNVDCSQDARLRGKEYQYALDNIAEVAKNADLTIGPGFAKDG